MRLVIIGAGFAGMCAALSAARPRDIRPMPVSFSMTAPVAAKS